MFVRGELLLGWPKLSQATFQCSGIEDAEVCIDLPALGIVEKCDGNAARSDGLSFAEWLTEESSP